MIHNDQELKDKHERITYFLDLLARLRISSRPEELTLVSGGYRAEVERMQREVLDYSRCRRLRLPRRLVDQLNCEAVASRQPHSTISLCVGCSPIRAFFAHCQNSQTAYPTISCIQNTGVDCDTSCMAVGCALETLAHEWLAADDRDEKVCAVFSLRSEGGEYIQYSNAPCVPLDFDYWSGAAP